ncbi:MAG: LuxR C-terminal-related transcriptional regulator [Treponema sp.]
MKGLDVLIQTGISIAFLLHYYGIGLLYGSKPDPALKLYKRMVLCFIAVTGSRAIDLLLSGWLFNLPITDFSRLFVQYKGEPVLITGSSITGLYIVLKLLLTVMNPACFLLLFPPIIIALIRMEGIPISRLQYQLKNMTLAVGSLCAVFYVIFPFLQNVNSLGLLTEGSLLAHMLAVSYRFVSVIFMVMYALFFAWAAHACKVQVLTPFPFIQKVFYRVIRIAGLICGWICIDSVPTLLHNFKIPIGVFTVFLHRSVPFPFYEDLLLYGLFAAAGLYVLNTHAKKRFNSLPSGYQTERAHIRQNNAPADTAAEKVGANGIATGNAFIMEETDEIKRQYHSFFIEKGLTEREADVAVLIAFAKSNKEIALALDIAYNTVKNHIANVYKKTGTHNRFDLARFANAGITLP